MNLSLSTLEKANPFILKSMENIKAIKINDSTLSITYLENDDFAYFSRPLKNDQSSQVFLWLVMPVNLKNTLDLLHKKNTLINIINQTDAFYIHSESTEKKLRQNHKHQSVISFITTSQLYIYPKNQPLPINNLETIEIPNIPTNLLTLLTASLENKLLTIDSKITLESTNKSLKI